MGPAQTIRNVSLAGREFPVPMLPPRVNRIVFPLCRKLDALVKRTVANGGSFDPSEEEYTDVLKAVGEAVAFGGGLLLEDFNDLPATPQEHFSALLVVRLQTGGWTLNMEAASEMGEAAGEG